MAENDIQICDHIDRVNVHPSIIVGGGVSITGRCPNKALPGMVVCYEHATKEAMAFWIKHLARKLNALGEEY